MFQNPTTSSSLYTFEQVDAPSDPLNGNTWREIYANGITRDVWRYVETQWYSEETVTIAGLNANLNNGTLCDISLPFRDFSKLFIMSVDVTSVHSIAHNVSNFKTFTFNQCRGVNGATISTLLTLNTRLHTVAGSVFSVSTIVNQEINASSGHYLRVLSASTGTAGNSAVTVSLSTKTIR